MTKPFVLIALTGLPATGKDTVADLLRTHQGFYKLAFADSLYSEAAAAFGVDVSFLQRRETKEHPLTALALSHCLSDSFTARIMVAMALKGEKLDLAAPRSPRQILQWWGTEYRRHQSPSYWSTRTSQQIKWLTDERIAHRFVITDCRFQNEADMVRARGGVVWQVQRQGIDKPASEHPSDTTGAEFNPDVVLHNDHDIRHLQQLVLGEFWTLDTGLSKVTVQIED